jgi:putative ABC transport system substrate-binding protein
LKESIPDVVFIERNASGSKAQIPATVRSVLAEGVDLLVPVTTPMSIESLSQASGRVPVVFLGVTDPIGAQLVSNLETPTTCTGVSDNPPMNGVIDLVRELLPNAKSIGIPFDPKDQPGVITADRGGNIAKSHGLEVELRPVTSENDLRAAIRALASHHDAIVIGMDNLMMKNAGIIAETAKDQGKPLFAADDKSAEMGAIAAVGVDYRDVGKLGADISLRVLKERVPVGTIPVAQLSTGKRFFNEKAAAALKIAIPVQARSHTANP